MSTKYDTPWWARTTVYQIYPRSFADTNADGIGDLRGIIGRLDYLRELGVETLWISPFYSSPQADFGYDISDHFDVAPEYGCLADVTELIREVHAHGMKIVFDMVLNHTSDQHPWFVESRASRESPRRDWYLWRDGKAPGKRSPPNNWRSMLGGSGWHYDEASGQWYWASFLPFQPDLNYRNPEVKRAMLDVVRHWLGAGVDGLRLDIFNAIYKDASFADNPFSMRPMPTEDNPHGFFQRHVHTIDHPDTLAFARELRTVVDAFRDPPRFVVGEVFGDAEMLRQYCGAEAAHDGAPADGPRPEPRPPAEAPHDGADGLHLVFLFQTLRTRFTGQAVRALITDIERAFPDPLVPTYVFGNHDRPRFMRRLGGSADKAKLLATLQLTVRGVPFIYYGEEIGMAHHDLPLARGLDPVAARFRRVPQWLAGFLRRYGILMNRDECRSPMQWHHGAHAGFTHEDATPWLPVHPEHPEVNVAAQEGDPASPLRCYRGLLALRRTRRALQEGQLALLDVPGLSRDVVAYRRTLGEGHPSEDVDVYLNFSRREHAVDLRGGRERAIFSNRRGEVVACGAEHVLAPYEGVVIFEPR
jgi:oligo-1,6-glucosidase/alpha-glucosidase